jgi:hypothetical protein
MRWIKNTGLDARNNAMRNGFLGLSLLALAGCASAATSAVLTDVAENPNAAPAAPTGPSGIYPGQMPATPELSAGDIIARAHAAAGGESWTRPGTLFLTGYSVMYRGDRVESYDKYAMWRVYSSEKTDAHAAEGRVRIEAWKGNELKLLLTFDGEYTWTDQGMMPPSQADAQWSNNFGFGAIRNALDEGWTQTRLPDDNVDGTPCYWVELKDPAGGVTRFAIAHETFVLLAVGFDTPRGWHERRYSDYYAKPGVAWAQPGRVRLFYDGVKQNEIIWTDFEIGGTYPEDIFRVEILPTKPTF